MKILFACMCVVITAARASANERVLVQVTQPVQGSGAGVLLADVCYVDWFNLELDSWPSVRLTTAANSIITDHGPQNLNVANALGFTVSLPGSPSVDPSKPQGLRGDTLDVNLAIPGLSERARPGFHGIAEATLECVLVNARRYWPRLRFVHVLMTGNDEFAQLSGTHSLESIQPRSGPRHPGDPEVRPR
jgi:hypothetical protein